MLCNTHGTLAMLSHKDYKKNETDIKNSDSILREPMMNSLIKDSMRSLKIN